jgi:site-specific recombinase XerD
MILTILRNGVNIMAKFDVGVIAELALSKLKHDGVMRGNKLSSYKTIGFRTVLKHFENLGSLSVDNDDLRGFLEQQYETYKNDRKRAWRWNLIRRSTEMLIYFAATGRVDLPPLPRWTKRDCQLYIEPREEQLADNDNIYGLVWRTRNALKAFGYAKCTIRYYDLSGFAKILNAHEEAGTEIYSRKLCAKLVLNAQKLVESGKQHKYQAIRKTAALLDEYHRYGMIIPAVLSPFNIVALSPEIETLVEEYGNDALLSGKLSSVTADTAKSIIKGFLLDLENAGYSSFDEITLSLVSNVIVQTAANHYKRGADSLLHYARDFLKYLYEYNLIKTDLSVAVPKIAAPFKKVYQGFTDDEIRKLLEAADRSTLIGKRDYAMMTLAAQTGLRAVDIVNLKRGDIDWRKREIHISQSKTGSSLCLALEVETGNAIYDYLLNARQNCGIPNVFLRAEYPLSALKPNATQSIVKKYMAIAGIEPDTRQRYGFHSFRRAFGTRLLESGTPIHLLSQLLGHIDLDSARPYISASEQGLKECCLSLTHNESECGAL